MFAEETLNQATGGPVSTRHLRQQAELNYQRRAEQAMADDNCFKFVFVSSSFVLFTFLMCVAHSAIIFCYSCCLGGVGVGGVTASSLSM